ncbi:MAG: hypothetical protein GX649_15170 [Chloroflexi bacterium]|nr:hypothetical protein [Chloroflexota bacterium]
MSIPQHTPPGSDGLPMPTIPFGPHRLSRLIVGANPVNGGSHLSRFVNHQMRRYFTGERIQQFLADCQAVGISAWQSGPQNLDDYARHRAAGGGLDFISLVREDPNGADEIGGAVAAGAIAVAHHGEDTDRLFKEGRLDAIVPLLARARDSGALVGISTHMPDVVDYVESAGWDIDFYMTCVYERHRTREELREILGYVPIPVREVYLEEDPARMYAAIRQTERPCLAFKILAAGRLCERQETVEAAFEQAFRSIKPTDAVIVGMYPEYEDQIALNAAYVRRFSALSEGTTHEPIGRPIGN